MTEWRAHELNKHQDHVVAHVVDATVLGYFHADDASHFVLDIGFIWTIYLDGEMGLVPQSMAIEELSVEASEKDALAEDVRALYEDGAEADSLARATNAPSGCRIEAVDFYTGDDGCRIVIRGEEASLTVESSLAAREMTVEASATAHVDGQIREGT
ncbi:MAG TPA: hypothetical protein VGB73_04220 [Pyrinomonadaceae bacterium]|jgi:hypothetical protein